MTRRRLAALLCILMFGGLITQAQMLDTTFRPILSGNGNYAGSIGGIMKRSDGKFVYTGSFREIGGVRRDSIAVVDQNGVVDPTFDIGELSTTVPQADVSIGGTLQPDDKILITGSFTHINGMPQGKLVRLN